MVNLFDLISNKVGNVGDKVGSFYKNLTTPNAPTLPVIQLADNGEIDYQKSFDETQKQPRGMWEHLTGRTITMDADSTDPETGEITTQRIAKFQPGFFNNLVSGAKENFSTGFAAPNLTDNTGEFGKKSASYRLGEGIGTLGRFLESPLGRGLLVGGIVGASGGSGLEALGYGAGTTMGNQGNRMRDRAYREQLEGMGVDTSNIRGYITDDVYKNIVSMKQLKDNADYRNALLETQQNNQLVSQQIAKDKLNYQMQQDARDYNLKNRELGLKEQKILNDMTKNVGKLDNLKAVSNQLKRFESTFADMPNKLESNTLGRVRNLTGFQTETEANFNSQRTLLFNKIARDLGGEKGVLSDQDIKRIEKALPDYTDSYAQKQAKMQAVYALLNDRLSVEGGSLDDFDTETDPLGLGL